jgi:hypothetical protein
LDALDAPVKWKRRISEDWMILRMQEGKEFQGKKQRREKKTLSLLGAADGERSMIKITRVIRMKNEEGF